MDINMPDMDGITATEELLKDVPFAQIVILSVQSDADYMRRAMLAGARDFIAKPPSGDELVNTIRVVAVRAREAKAKLSRPVQQVAIQGPSSGMMMPQRPKGKVLAFYSPKGGVGCTTLATNVALGLNSEETPTVLVDLNLQFGDVSVFLNLQVKNSIVDLAARSEDIDPEVLEDVLMAHETGLRVLAAPPRPEMADEVQAEQVRRVLQYLHQSYAYIVVDTSSTIDDVTLAVMDVADMLVTIATPDIPAIKDARLLFDLLNVLEFPREGVFFVLNKMDRKSGITAEAVAENLKEKFRPTIEWSRLPSIAASRYCWGINPGRRQKIFSICWARSRSGSSKGRGRKRRPPNPLVPGCAAAEPWPFIRFLMDRTCYFQATPIER
jgi:pilus assembly protein CpaE